MMDKKLTLFNFKNKQQTPDWLGIISSGLCLVHCVALPVMLFLPISFTLPELAYWDYLNYAFLALSFLACCHTGTKCTTKNLIALLWFFFGLLAISVIWHDLSTIFEYTLYVASLGLIACHALHIKYCKSI